MRPVRMAVGCALALGLMGDVLGEAPRRAEAAKFMNDLMSGKGQVGGPFTLADPDGRKRSLSDFRGKLVLLYFGYTFCPDVCPTDLLAMAQLMALMGSDANMVQPVFVTLDPLLHYRPFNNQLSFVGEDRNCARDVWPWRKNRRPTSRRRSHPSKWPTWRW